MSPSAEPNIMLRWVLARLRCQWRALLCVLILSLVASAVALAGPYLTKRMIDEGLLGKDFSLLWQLAVLSVSIAVGAALLSALNRWLYLHTSARLLLLMRRSVFSHLLHLPAHFFHARRYGDLLARLDGDVGEVQRFAVDSLLASVNACVVLVGALALMLSFSADLTLLAFVLLPATLLFLIKTRPLVEQHSRVMRERVSAVTAFMVEHLPAAKLLQSYSATGHSLGVLDEVQARYKAQLIRSQMLGLWVSTVPGLFNAMATALVFTVGGYWVIHDQMTLGTLVAFSAYLGRATGPVQTLLGLYVAWQRAKVSLQRLDELMHWPTAIAEPVTPQAAPQGPLALALKSVSYQHPQHPEQALHALDAVINPGSVWQISGASGQGKSTLLDLLQRHMDPQQGDIVLGGVPLPQWPLSALRQQVRLVAQDTPLLDDTLRENLCLGDAFSDQQLCQALEAMQAGPWLAQLKDGLDTKLGARGARLSGGERQRVALARLYLREARVILLDEATSALDAETEQQVIAALRQRFPQATWVLITHREPVPWPVDVYHQLHNGRWVTSDE